MSSGIHTCTQVSTRNSSRSWEKFCIGAFCQNWRPDLQGSTGLSQLNQRNKFFTSEKTTDKFYPATAPNAMFKASCYLAPRSEVLYNPL